MPSSISDLSGPERERLLRVAQEATAVESHYQLFRWLQADFQSFLPHEVMVGLVGDFSVGYLDYDIVSALPGIRTANCLTCEHVPVSIELFERWQSNGREMLVFDTPLSELVNPACTYCGTGQTLLQMGAALVHGLRDARSGKDALYLFCRSGPAFDERERAMLTLLLPQIDFGCRRVVVLRSAAAAAAAAAADAGEPASGADGMGVSMRELEILEWVKAGKTNSEIGDILDISPFTVKNHLQRIFRKMNVLNRAQAVAKLGGAGRRH